VNGPAAARSAVEAPTISPADRWISRAAAATVVGLAGIAGAISYSHMRELAQEHGQAGWHAHAFPLSVDGIEIVASLVLLADRRASRRSGWLPWAALVIGTAGSLAANVATAGPATISRLIAGWPALALLIAVKLRRVPGHDRLLGTPLRTASVPPARHRMTTDQETAVPCPAGPGTVLGLAPLSLNRSRQPAPPGRVAPGRPRSHTGRPRCPPPPGRSPGPQLPPHAAAPSTAKRVRQPEWSAGERGRAWAF
jgi:hypothetical protein